MKVVKLNRELPEAKRKKDLLEIIDSFRKRIDDGEVDEFVIASMDPIDGEVVITACCQDFVGAVGLFEIGKNILIQSNNGVE
jgi:hypothetical protein